MQSRKTFLNDMVKAVRVQKVESMLDMKTTNAFSRTCQFFHHEIKGSKHWHDGRQAFLQKQEQFKKLIVDQAGVDRGLFDQVLQMNVIHNYEHLYHTLMKLEIFSNAAENAWELLVLSGEADAIQYAIDHHLLTADTLNKFNENALHLAVFSGKVSAVQKVMSSLAVDPNALNKGHLNLFSLAAWRGEIEMVHYLHFLHQQGKLIHTPYSVAAGERETAFDYGQMHSPSDKLQAALATPDQVLMARFASEEKERKVTAGIALR